MAQPTDTITSTSPASAAQAMMPVTITNLALIALAIVATLVMIWYGSRLWRRRDAAETEMEERGVGKRIEEAPPVDAAPAEPRERPHFAEEQPQPDRVTITTPPAAVAPSPPPVADAALPATPPAADPASPPVTILKGLGPKVAAQLAVRNIATVADLASLSPEQAEALDADLGPFRGRMARDRWLEQARLLHTGDRAAYEAQFGKLG
ncbi:helix-hairpin-helix domain-containing protein [Sphingomonas sp.]